MKAHSEDEHATRKRQFTIFRPILDALEVEDVDQVQFYACFTGWYSYDEIAQLMRQLGVRRTANAIEQMYDGQKVAIWNWLEQHDFCIPYDSDFAYRDGFSHN